MDVHDPVTRASCLSLPLDSSKLCLSLAQLSACVFNFFFGEADTQKA